MTTRVFIAGYYGYGNTGDEAILRVITHQLENLLPEIRVVVASGNPPQTTNAHHVEAVASKDIQAIINKIHESDFVILGGGGIFHDYWAVNKKDLLTHHHSGISYYIGFPLLAWLMNKPFTIYSVGVGPLFHSDGMDLTREIFSLARYASVRDQESRILLSSLGVSIKNIRVSADPAFCLSADPFAAEKVLDQCKVGSESMKVGICLRNWVSGVNQNEWKAPFADSLDEFHKKTGCQFLFVPMQILPGSKITNDLAAAESVLRLMKERGSAFLVRKTLDPGAAAGVLAKCDMVIGMRLHALIFAAKAGVPIVGISYDPKVTHLMNRIGMKENLLDLKKISTQELLDTLSLTLKNRRNIRKILLENSESLKQLALEDLNSAVTSMVSKRESTDTRHDQFIKELIVQQSSALDGKEKELAALAELIQQKEKDILQLIEDKGKNEIMMNDLTSRLEEKTRETERLNHHLLNKNQELDQKRSDFDRLVRELQVNKQAAHDYANELNQIYHSNGWRLINFLWRGRKRLVPGGSARERVIQAFSRGIRAAVNLPGILHQRTALLFHRIARLPRPFRESYSIMDNSEVATYKKHRAVDQINDFKQRPADSIHDSRHRVSLVAAVKNEILNIEPWFRRISEQTRLPDEIIILDGGSTDGTLEKIRQVTRHYPINIRVETNPTFNIAKSRNAAIHKARNALIAVTDFGCLPAKDWLENLILPFEMDDKVIVSGGIYQAVDQMGSPARTQRLWLWTNVEKIQPQHYLPPGGCAAFRKEAWQSVSGYPEWLTLTGEDTYFDLELKRLGGRWAFSPDAVVQWHAPDTIKEYLKKLHQWAAGDGETGVHALFYWRSLLRLLALVAGTVLAFGLALLLSLSVKPSGWTLGVGVLAAWMIILVFLSLQSQLSLPLFFQKVSGEAAQILGYLSGYNRRSEVSRRRFAAVKGLILILSGVPIDDTGGGSRGTQLTLELVRQNYAVWHIHKFPKHERKDLGLHIAHPNLLISPLDEFQWKRMLQGNPTLFKNRNIGVIVEHPIADFLPVISVIRRHNGIVIYDLIDQWSTSLGSPWYSPEIEHQIIKNSHLLSASARNLSEHLEKLSSKAVIFLPNAVDHRLFNPHRTYPRPVRMPEADWTMIHTGSLWGEWFDWELLKRLALEYPEAAVILIGDYRNQCQHPPANIYFLGLQPQRELPGYLAHAQVAIIPWKKTSITQATSPIKLYEYLAMRLPVVAPNIQPLHQMPGVLLAKDETDFISKVQKAREIKIDERSLASFIQKNTWEVRANKLISSIDRSCTGKENLEG